jgi:hypothetical protein
MSYDLTFTPGRGKTLDKKSFAAHFRRRRNYTVGNGQAVYQNEDTGVYFIFDEPSDGVVAFNLNYYRPHVFGLEAAIELKAFADALGATAVDDSGDEWEFTTERFLDQWNDGNRFAYRAMLDDPDESVHTWPSRRLREVWEWNYSRPSEDEQDAQGVFVPAIFADEVGGDTQSVAIWPPQCPILLPAVDAVLVPLAQRGKASEDLALVPWAELSPIAKAYQVKATGLPRYRLAFDEPPPEVAAFLAKKRKRTGEINGISLDQVLDRELVDKARKK